MWQYDVGCVYLLCTYCLHSFASCNLNLLSLPSYLGHLHNFNYIFQLRSFRLNIFLFKDASAFVVLLRPQLFFSGFPAFESSLVNRQHQRKVRSCKQLLGRENISAVSWGFEPGWVHPTCRVSPIFGIYRGSGSLQWCGLPVFCHEVRAGGAESPPL